MSQDQFNKFLKESGLPKEFSQKINQLVRVINDHEEKIKFLEASMRIKDK